MRVSCSVQINGWQCEGGFLEAESRSRSFPCPKCNTELFLLNAKRVAAAPTKLLRAVCPCCDRGGSAAEFWLSALRTAQHYNVEALDDLLPRLGPIETFDEDYRPVVIRYDGGERPASRRKFGCDSPET